METTINTKINVSGLAELEKAISLSEKLKSTMSSLGSASSGDGGAKMYANIEKATVQAQKLKSEITTINESSNRATGFSKMVEGIDKSVSGTEKLNGSLKESVSLTERMTSANEKLQTTQSGISRSRQEEVQHGQALTEQHSKMANESAKTQGAWSKIGGTIKDSFAMFSVGMLGMTAVNGAAEGIMNTFKSGWDNIKEKSAASAQWRTYTESAKVGNSQANTLSDMSLNYGQDFGLVNESARQIYMGLEGKNKVARANRMTTDVLKGIDAEGMSNQDAERFTKYAIGNAMDNGRVDSRTLKEMTNYAPQIKDAFVKSLQANGRKVKNYGDVRKLVTDGKVDAGDLEKALNYAGSHEWKDASKNLLSTIPGILRVMKTGSAQFMGTFEKSFMGPLGKTVQPFALKMSKWFTDGGADGAAKKMGSALSGITKSIVNGATTIAPYVSKFSSGFAKGFTSGLQDVVDGVKKAYDGIKEVGKWIGDMLPKGAADGIKDVLSHIGEFAGKVGAFAVALRGFSKLPFLGGAVSKIVGGISGLISKVPLIGKPISGIISKLTGIKPKENTAASKMMSAANIMNEAATRMNGGNPNSLTGSAETMAEEALNPADYSTRAEYRAAKRTLNKKPTLGSRWIAKGESLLGTEGTRVANNTGWFKKIRGNSLIKLGGLSEKISSSKLGTMFKGLGKGIRVTGSGLKATGKFLGRGMPGMNMAFAGMDALSAMGTTQAGSLARHQKVGGAIGSGVGGTVGMALGALIPGLGETGIGEMAGGAAGSWVGNKVGNWVGGLFGGSKPKKPKKTKSASYYQQKAEYDAQIDQQASAIVSGKGAKNKTIAKTGLRAISNAQGTKSEKAQKFAANANMALQNGDFKSYQDNLKKGANETAKYYAKLAKSSKKTNEANKDALDDAQKAYNKLKKSPNTMLSQQKKQEAKNNLDDAKEKYNKSNKKYGKDKKKASDTDKDSVDLGNKSVNGKKNKSKNKSNSKSKNNKKDSAKASDNVKKTNKDADKLNGKLKKNNKDSKKNSKDQQKDFKKISKAQKKELDKQTKAMKKAEKAKTKAVKSANKLLKKAQKKAAKDIAKADKKASKAMSKNYKTASKQVSKAIKQGMKSAAKQAKSGAKKIAKNIKSGMKNVGKDTKKAFKKMSKSVKSGMKSAQKAAKSGSKKISKSIKSGLKNVGKSAKKAFKSFGKNIKSAMKSASKTAKSGAKNISKSIKSGLKNVGKSAKSAFKSLSKSVKSGMKTAKAAAKSGAKSIVSAIKSGLSKIGDAGKSGFNKLSSSAKSGMNKVEEAVKSGAEKSVNSFKSSFTKLASVATSVSSKVASAMDKIGSSAAAAASKVKSLQSAINSLKSKTVTITANVKGSGASKLATGTPGAKDLMHLETGTPSFDAPSHLAGGWSANGGTKAGMYVVNDAKGSRWREAFKLKNGLMGLFPNKKNLRVPLPEGTQVLNGEDTHSMFPHLATGTPGAKSEMAKSGEKKQAPNINITINLNGNADASVPEKIANAIGEKLQMIMPELQA